MVAMIDFGFKHTRRGEVLTIGVVNPTSDEVVSQWLIKAYFRTKAADITVACPSDAREDIRWNTIDHWEAPKHPPGPCLLSRTLVYHTCGEGRERFRRGSGVTTLTRHIGDTSAMVAQAQ